MTLITYGPQVNVHPDRIYFDRADQVPMIKYLILHTSEQSGAEDANDAEDLARYLESPGDRPSSYQPSGRYGSSYHGITDTDRILPCVVDTKVAYAAGGGNKYGLHLCLPVKIAQTREQWLDATSRPYIEQAARWLIDKGAKHGIPMRRITSSQMANGMTGFADHATVTAAFGKSSHTDVGPNFPWDVLAADIERIIRGGTTPPPPPPSKPATTDLWYPVRKGQTIWSITNNLYVGGASEGNGNVDAVVAANGGSTTIIPGQELALPGKATRSTTSSYYGIKTRVVKGENGLWDVAGRVYGDGSQRANSDALVKQHGSTLIHVDEVIGVPGKIKR